MMSKIISIFLEANLVILLLWGFYLFFLKNETDFSARRVFILAIAVFALILPVVSLLEGYIRRLTEIAELPAFSLPSFEIISQSSTITQSSDRFQILDILLIAYALIAAFIIIRLIKQVASIITISKLNPSEKSEGYNVILTNGKYPIFSFFNFIFFDNSVALNETEKSKILAHEQLHIRLKHSIDILLIEVIRGLFWINPAVWWIRQEISEIHEYQVDNILTNNSLDDQYQTLLSKLALQRFNLSPANYFNNSITLKRINMMKTQKNKLKLWKMMLGTTFIALLFITLSCNDDVVQDLNEVLNKSTMGDMPAYLQPELAKLQAQNPGTTYKYVTVTKMEPSELAELVKKSGGAIGFAEINGETKEVDMLINFKGNFEIFQSKSMEMAGDEVFTVVKDQPSPVDGMTVFFQNIGKNIKYPAEAREAGIEGKVLVQFIVDTDGTLKDLIAVKGIDPACDEAAIEAILAAGAWNPGKQAGKAVKVRMILPIAFKLDEAKEESKSTTVVDIKIDN
jgi:TonB family protein